MNDKVKNLAKTFFQKYAKDLEKLTIQQFEDALVGAIKSGDFVRHVRGYYPNAKQGMSYIPYRDKHVLESKIIKLKRLLFLTDESVSDIEMNEVTARQINAYYKAFPEEMPDDGE